MNSSEVSTLNMLDPDDKLMKKFQKTLYTHLSNVNNRLSEELHELELSVKQVEKELESEGVILYQTQQEIQHQHTTINQYLEALTKVTLLREKRNHNIEGAKQALKESRCKLEEEKNKREKLSQELKNLLSFHDYLSKWENDLNDFLKISKQISSQDANKKKMLINKKQQRDFILYRLREEIWKVDAEIAYLDEQLQIKDKEKEDANRMIVDVNTDLETLHAERKDLHDIWKSVVANIYKRNSFHDQLQSQQEEAQKLCNTLLLEIQKVKKETEKEMEINEHLTSLLFRIENDIRIISKIVTMYNEKITDVELQLLKLTKVNEQIHCDYDTIFAKYQSCLYEEEQVNKKFEIIFGKKVNLESAIFKKLEEKIICDKTAQYVNELLLNTKNAVLELEISVARIENSYGNSLLELEKFTNLLENQKTDLQDILQKNAGKEKQMDELQKEIKKYETVIERKQRKLLVINKCIEQIMPSVGEDLSPQDLRITSLEKNIQELQQSIQKAQQFWMRQQGFMVSLSQQRESQLRELSILDKEIMIMGQKNFKLEYALEMLMKEESHVNKSIFSLQQKLLRMNTDLVTQKDLKEELEDKNCIIKNECILSFQELELELIKLQSNLRNICSEKVILKEELKSAQQESLSWEKKVQLVQETVKKIKEERTAGGIASMKSEIHKMEMRLSYLKKIQEKLVHDMELCVTRRDVIFNKVLSKFNKNPKERHNEKVVMHKRLSDKRTKIKHVLKATKLTDDTVKQLKGEMKSKESKLTKCKEDLENLKGNIPSIENEIGQLEILKYHNLHTLILKQRKVKQLHDVKSGTYKMMYRSEHTIEENLKMEHSYRQHLKHVLEKTDHDFPMLQASLRKILLTLKIL
ncbi:PREDICTED: coiled-coil domain-containing protein 40 [Dufourea novaeangliae]|uniref:coiled-coil domain-containing protein 40 n=1 Tax=Dufourea novaeangliae TaxID=178035 RepID=UPI0007672E2D|nr:PREDICTED: coiled-coil domain-containing protein 40 [Dufourea novaeangliae]